MSKTLVLEDQEFEALQSAAAREGKTVEAWLVDTARRQQPTENGGATAVSAASPTLNGPNSDWGQILRRFGQERAARYGGTPEEHIAAFQASVAPRPMPQVSEEEREAAKRRLYRHFGSVSSGDPNSADNERIDHDLMQWYLKELDGSEESA